jgi:hypothetical protein
MSNPFIIRGFNNSMKEAFFIRASIIKSPTWESVITSKPYATRAKAKAALKANTIRWA